MDPAKKKQIDALLSGFEHLDDFRLDQAKGWLEDKDGVCSACVGTWIAVFLGLPKVQLFDSSGWVYNDGVKAIQEVFELYGFDLEALLEDNGAPWNPFGTVPWDNRVFSVLKDAAEERFGYNYQGTGIAP